MFSEVDLMSMAQRRIIVHSRIYYTMGTSLISDKEFDIFARQLEASCKNNPEQWKQSRYFYVFGPKWHYATGMGLYESLNRKDKVYIDAVIRSLFQGV